MSQFGGADLNFLNPNQQQGPGQQMSPWGHPNFTARGGRQPGWGGGQQVFNPQMTAQIQQNQQRQGGAPSPNQPSNMVDQAWLAFLNDYDRMQTAADTQYNKVNGQAQGVNQAFQQGANRVGQVGEQSAQMLSEMAGGMYGMGEQSAQRLDQSAQGMNDFADQGNPQMDQDIDAAYAKGDQSETTMQRGINEYQDRTAQDATVTSGGIQNQAASRIKQLDNDMASGMITEQQYRAEKYQLQMDTSHQVQGAVTQIYSKMNETMVQLKANMASLQSQNAGLRIQGAGLRQGERGMQVELKKAAGQMTAQAGELRHKNNELLGQMGGVISQVMNAGVMNAANMTAQGRMQMAQIIQNNPQSIISLFSGISAMLALASAPGVGAIGAARVPNMTGGGIR